MPRRAFHDVVVVVGDGDKLAADRAAGELDGMDIEVEWNLVAHRGRPQNAREGARDTCTERKGVGDWNRVRRFPDTAHRPGAIRIKHKSTVVGVVIGVICPNTTGPFVPRT